MTDRQGALGTLVIARRARAAGGTRRFLLPLPRRHAWSSTNGSRSRPRRSAPDTSTRCAAVAAPRLHARQPQSRARAGRQLRREPVGVPPGRRARLSLRRRHDPGHGQAQPAGRGAAGAAARPLAAFRRRARSTDARRARANRRGAGPVEGRVTSRPARAWPERSVPPIQLARLRARPGWRPG